jgi:hypothetical protein
MRKHRGLRLLLVLTVLATARTAGAAAILYNIYGGFEMVGELSVPLDATGGGDVPGFVEGGPRSRGGAICPAPTTPDFICGYAFASTDLVGGSTFTLRAETRLERRQAVGVGAPELAYGDARIELFGVTGVLLPLSGYAKFNFILTGTTSQTPSSGEVTVEALATARLEVDQTRSLQCLGTTCPPIEVRYDPSDSNAWDGTYIGLFLRADSRITGANGAAINAEAHVDVRDTMQLTSIEVLDDDRQPVPGAAFVVDLGNGNVITIPSTPPPSTTTTTTTTTPGGSTTTTTTTPGGLTQRFVAGKTIALKDNAKPTKRSGVVIVTGDVTGLDPTQGGAEVRLYGPTTATRDTWPLPAAGWKKTKKGYKYTDKAHANGPVTAAVVAGGKLVVKAKGTAIAFPLLGTGPQQAIATAALFPGSSAVLCADFTTPKKDDPAKGIFVAAKAPAPAACRAL